MRRGQGALEYLLILAAILAIAVVVVVVATSMLQPGKEAGQVTEDKYKCSLAGIELVDYNSIPDDPSTVTVRYGGTQATCDGNVDNPDASCRIGENDEHLIEVKLSDGSLTCEGSTP